MFRFSHFVFLATLLVGSTQLAHAQAPGRVVRLNYNAAGECPDQGAFSDEIASRLGRVAVDSGSSEVVVVRMAAAGVNSTLREERALIDQARAALRANRHQDALRALMSHERRFSSGSLAEERDRLSVEALVRAGRGDQARRRAALFESRYPQSPHRQRVRELVAP